MPHHVLSVHPIIMSGKHPYRPQCKCYKKPHTNTNMQWNHKFKCGEILICLTFGWNVSDADTASAREEWCPRDMAQCSGWLIGTCTHTHTHTHTCNYTQKSKYIFTHTDIHSHGRQKLLFVGRMGSSPSLIPVELSAAQPVECIPIAAGNAVRVTVFVSHGLQGNYFWSQTVHRCMSINIDMHCKYYYTTRGSIFFNAYESINSYLPTIPPHLCSSQFLLKLWVYLCRKLCGTQYQSQVEMLVQCIKKGEWEVWVRRRKRRVGRHV